MASNTNTHITSFFIPDGRQATFPVDDTDGTSTINCVEYACSKCSNDPNITQLVCVCQPQCRCKYCIDNRHLFDTKNTKKQRIHVEELVDNEADSVAAGSDKDDDYDETQSNISDLIDDGDILIDGASQVYDNKTYTVAFNDPDHDNQWQSRYKNNNKNIPVVWRTTKNFNTGVDESKQYFVPYVTKTALPKDKKVTNKGLKLLAEKKSTSMGYIRMIQDVLKCASYVNNDAELVTEHLMPVEISKHTFFLPKQLVKMSIYPGTQHEKEKPNKYSVFKTMPSGCRQYFFGRDGYPIYEFDQKKCIFHIYMSLIRFVQWEWQEIQKRVTMQSVISISDVNKFAQMSLNKNLVQKGYVSEFGLQNECKKASDIFQKVLLPEFITTVNTELVKKYRIMQQSSIENTDKYLMELMKEAQTTENGAIEFSTKKLKEIIRAAANGGCTYNIKVLTNIFFAMRNITGFMELISRVKAKIHGQNETDIHVLLDRVRDKEPKQKNADGEEVPRNIDGKRMSVVSSLIIERINTLAMDFFEGNYDVIGIAGDAIFVQARTKQLWSDERIENTVNNLELHILDATRGMTDIVTCRKIINSRFPGFKVAYRIEEIHKDEMFKFKPFTMIDSDDDDSSNDDDNDDSRNDEVEGVEGVEEEEEENEENNDDDSSNDDEEAFVGNNPWAPHILELLDSYGNANDETNGKKPKAMKNDAKIQLFFHIIKIMNDNLAFGGKKLYRVYGVYKTEEHGVSFFSKIPQNQNNNDLLLIERTVSWGDFYQKVFGEHNFFPWDLLEEFPFGMLRHSIIFDPEKLKGFFFGAKRGDECPFPDTGIELVSVFHDRGLEEFVWFLKDAVIYTRTDNEGNCCDEDGNVIVGNDEAKTPGYCFKSYDATRLMLTQDDTRQFAVIISSKHLKFLDISIDDIPPHIDDTDEHIAVLYQVCMTQFIQEQLREWYKVNRPEEYVVGKVYVYDSTLHTGIITTEATNAFEYVSKVIGLIFMWRSTPFFLLLYGVSQSGKSIIDEIVRSMGSCAIASGSVEGKYFLSRILEPVAGYYGSARTYPILINGDADKQGVCGDPSTESVLLTTVKPGAKTVQLRVMYSMAFTLSKCSFFFLAAMNHTPEFGGDPTKAFKGVVDRSAIDSRMVILPFVYSLKNKASTEEEANKLNATIAAEVNALNQDNFDNDNDVSIGERTDEQLIFVEKTRYIESNTINITHDNRDTSLYTSLSEKPLHLICTFLWCLNAAMKNGNGKEVFKKPTLFTSLLSKMDDTTIGSAEPHIYETWFETCVEHLNTDQNRLTLIYKLYGTDLGNHKNSTLKGYRREQGNTDPISLETFKKFLKKKFMIGGHPYLYNGFFCKHCDRQYTKKPGSSNLMHTLKECKQYWKSLVGRNHPYIKNYICPTTHLYSKHNTPGTCDPYNFIRSDAVRNICLIGDLIVN